MGNNRGITLIELIIVIALIGIVLSIVFSPVTFSFRNFDAQNEKAAITSRARAAMDYLTREIRKSDIVEINDNVITVNLDGNENKYKLENKILFKNDKKIIDGIDGLNISPDIDPDIDPDNITINIKITIKDSKGKDHTLSSDINIR